VNKHPTIMTKLEERERKAKTTQARSTTTTILGDACTRHGHT
jgi:hypothetical protein